MDGVDVIDILDVIGVGRVTTPYWSLLRLKRQGFIVVGICDYRAKLTIFFTALAILSPITELN